MVEGGATTLWESWKFSDNTYSNNHPMFGSITEWFYRGLAGINPAEDAAGWNRILLRPNPVEGLDWVRAEYRSVRGPIRSAWKREAGRITWDVTIPPNTTATVYVPTPDPAKIKEGGKPATTARGVKLESQSAGNSIFSVGSGTYRFTWRPN
jgi:alpha-L-rhamnosidase